MDFSSFKESDKWTERKNKRAKGTSKMEEVLLPTRRERVHSSKVLSREKKNCNPSFARLQILEREHIMRFKS